MRREKFTLGTVVLATVIFGEIFVRMGQPLDAWRLLSFSLVALVFLNIVVFLHNLIKAMVNAHEAKDQKDFERIVEPALRGNPAQLNAGSKRIYGWTSLLCLGIFAGAIVLLILRHYKIGF